MSIQLLPLVPHGRASVNVGERFNPYQRFPGIFIPEPICMFRGLSPGAKLVYGRLCRYAGENGEVYPAAVIARMWTVCVSEDRKKGT
jgi:hypothetical protein